MFPQEDPERALEKDERILELLHACVAPIRTIDIAKAIGVKTTKEVRAAPKLLPQRACGVNGHGRRSLLLKQLCAVSRKFRTVTKKGNWVCWCQVFMQLLSFLGCFGLWLFLFFSVCVCVCVCGVCVCVCVGVCIYIRSFALT